MRMSVRAVRMTRLVVVITVIMPVIMIVLAMQLMMLAVRRSGAVSDRFPSVPVVHPRDVPWLDVP